jgi:hypothetical protein
MSWAAWACVMVGLAIVTVFAISITRRATDCEAQGGMLVQGSRSMMCVDKSILRETTRG